MRMEKDLIKESKEIAEKIIKGEFRLTIAKYYLLWSTFPLVLFTLFLINTRYPFLNYPIALSGYLYYNFKIFSDFSKTVERVNGIKRRGKGKYYVITALWSIPTAMIIVGLDFNYPYLTLAGSAIFGIVYSLFAYYYFKKSFHDFHYYDLLAMITLMAEIISIGICVTLKIPLLEIMWVPFTLSWIYAAYASFMEVIEGE
jgi:hypothetical protein